MIKFLSLSVALETSEVIILELEARLCELGIT